MVFSVKLKQRFYLFIIILYAPLTLFAQSSNTVFKAGLESGKINTERFGDGLFYRGLLKISSYKKFSNSAIRIKANASSEILDLRNRISGIHLFARIEYSLVFNKEKLLLNGSAKKQLHFIKSQNSKPKSQTNHNFQNPKIKTCDLAP